MKNLLFSGLLLVAFCVKAQKLELKTHLTNVLVGTYGLSAEYLIDDNISVEITPSLLSANQKTPLKIFVSPFNNVTVFNISSGVPQTKGYTLQARAKYYFTPKTRCDNFGLGTFLRYSASKVRSRDFITSNITVSGISVDENRLVFGVICFYKKVFSNNLVLEGGFGEGFVIFDEAKIVIPDGVGGVVTSNFVSSIDRFGLLSKFTPTFNLSVGYRFGVPKKEIITED